MKALSVIDKFFALPLLGLIAYVVYDIWRLTAPETATGEAKTGFIVIGVMFAIVALASIGIFFSQLWAFIVLFVASLAIVPLFYYAFKNLQEQNKWTEFPVPYTIMAVVYMLMIVWSLVRMLSWKSYRASF